MLRRVAAVVLVCVLAGCQPSARERLAGQWEGRIVFDETRIQEKLNQAQNPIQRALMQGFVESVRSGRVRFDLKRDGTFTAAMTMGPLSNNNAGTWSVVSESGNRVSLQLAGNDGQTKTASVDFAQEDVLTAELDGEAKGLGVFECGRVTQ